MMQDWGAFAPQGSMQQAATQPRQRLLCHFSAAVILLGVQHNIVFELYSQQAR
jgi:hypothetical protein